MAVLDVHRGHGMTDSAFAHSAIEHDLDAMPSSKQATRTCVALRVAPRNDQQEWRLHHAPNYAPDPLRQRSGRLRRQDTTDK
jgi:hypothetical protein